MLFFYGVVLCVGGLEFIGYLGLASELMYGHWSATAANVAVGVISAIIDNIPVMFAVLTMNPDMSTGQWLLVTLTAGVGGSLLSIVSSRVNDELKPSLKQSGYSVQLGLTGYTISVV